VRLKLGKIQRRIETTHRVRFTYDDALVDAVAARCTEVESGARNVDNILTNTLLPEVSVRILEQIASGEPIASIHMGVTADGVFTYDVNGGARPQPAPAAAALDAMGEGSFEGVTGPADGAEPPVFGAGSVAPPLAPPAPPEQSLQA
jgi:type VI secretion system protein VasG